MMKKSLLIVILINIILSGWVFGQCPPPGFPATGDMCSFAPTLCVDLNGYCATLGTNNIQQDFPGCAGNVLNNDEWFAFIAGSTAITLEIVPSNCQGVGGQFGMQGAIYEGSCTGPAVATQCNCVQTTFNMSGTFIPGQVYYVVFDGCAGDICDFQVNVLQGSTVPIPPDDPSPIMGPTNVCPGATTNYTISNPAVATFDWTLMPGNAGTLSGSPGGSVSVNWSSSYTGPVQLCVTSSNPCFTGNTVCLNINSSPVPPTNESYNLCLGDCLVCAGQTFCTGTGPSGSPVTLTNYLGCDSVVVCHITQIPAINNNIGMVTICSPATFNICGTQYGMTEFISHSCQGASWHGCDSTVIVDLAVLNPNVVIQPPGVIGCGAASQITLNATGSEFSQVPGGNVTMLWTGPGIAGPNDQPIVDVTLPGQYCFTITASRNGVSCNDQACVTVTSNIQVPQTPQISGNLTPCQGTSATYTVTPVGNPAPTGYTWITPNNEAVTQLTPTTVSVAWATAAGGQLCVTANNACGSSPPACLAIAVSALPNTPQINGPTTVCGNQTQVYSVTNTQAGVTYNWSVPTGATFTGSGSSITVDFSGATNATGQVCVTAQNNCGSTNPASCVNVTITSVPAMPTMSGPAVVCNNGGNYTYTISNPIAGLTYNWTVPTGATFTGSGSSIDVNYSGATGASGQVCVTAQNSCGTSMQKCQLVQITTAPAGTISGSGAICQGGSGQVDLTITLTGAGPWTVTYDINNGADSTLNITSSPYTLVATQPGTYVLTSVTLANSTCAGTTSGSAVISQNPAPQATLTGGGAICAGSGQTVPLNIALTGTGPWDVSWTRNGSSQATLTIPANQNPYTWNISQTQAGTIAITGITDANGCVGTATGSAVVTVNTAPTVSNISADCDPTTQDFTVIFTINGGDPTTYSVTPLDGTLNGNIFTSNPFPSGQGYSFVVDDGNNCSPVTISDNAVVCNCTSAVGEMDLAAIDVCGNGPTTGIYDNANQVFDGNDALAFVFHTGSGLTIVPPILSTTSTPDVSFNGVTMTYGTTYYLSAVVGDSDGVGGIDLNDPCLQVAQGTPVVFNEIPTAFLSGSDAICDGQNGQLTITFTGTGPWDISYDDGTGNTQSLSGVNQNPYLLIVSPTATTDYCLTAVTDANCVGTASGCGTVTVNSGVTVSGLMVNCNATSTAYTVSFNISNGDPTSYVVTGVNGNIVNGVFTSISIPSGQGYSLVVDDANGCDPQSLAQTTVNCNCSTDAGDMDALQVVVCGDGPVSLVGATNFNLDADDLLQYVLRPDNFGIISTVLATSNTPDFSFISGTMTYGTTYYVSAIAGNDDGSGNVDLTDPCLSVSSSTPVVFRIIPNAVISGSSQICEGGTTNLMVQLTGQGPWTLEYQAGTGTPATSVTASGSPFNIPVSPNSNTTYTLVSVSNAFCTGTVSGTATVNVNNPPTVANIDWTCDPTGQNYTVSFDIQGGDATSYVVTPTGTLAGNSYTSNPITNGSTYSFQVDDANGCGPTPVTGAFDCNCTTDAGTMSATQISVCVNEMVVADTAVGSSLDGNDILVYVLHTGSSNILGTVLATNSTPDFSFIAGQMTPGTVYYISAIAGNDNGNGGVNANDPCFNVSVGTPVVFNALPTASISGTTSICQGQTAQFTGTVTGVGPFVVNFTINTIPQTQTIPTPGTFQLPPVSTTTSITLTGITDNGTGCSNTATGTATITVTPNASAGTSIGNLTYCEGEATAFDLDDQLTSADPSGQWTGASGVIANGQVDPSNFAAGTYAYTYTVAGIGNCPDDTETVSLILNSAPIVNAGLDQTLTCDLTAVPLGGTNTTTGATYAWTGGTVANPSIAVTATSQPGTYTLLVTTSEGCTAQDQVVVDALASVPNLSIVISDVSCFGNSDGTVTIDSVWGGTEPYVFSLNNSPFSATTQFTNLGQGQYSIQVMDAGGCEAESSFSVTEPAEVTVQIIGNFQGSNNVIDLGDELILSILSTPSSSEMDSILWSTNGLDSCATCPEIKVSPTAQTNYTVLVSENGCEATDGITVFVEKNRPVYVPNVFSPNDDGINDFFTIYAGKSVTKIKSFVVFSRWGETLYSHADFVPNDPAVGWDGKHRGKELQPAVFTWFAEIEFLDGRTEIYKGDVSLVR